MQELNWLINICFTIFMAGLFVWDFKTFGEPTHKDFKAIIMSTGVLGTFVGIFIGLIGFDTRALQDSVPLLLDGLKTAFYTSIMGMGLAIALSIIQRIRGIKSSQDANMDYMIYQVGNLNYLKGIEEINKNIANLPTKNDMIQINTTTNALLESSLKKIDISLQEAIKQLALGASKELIAALELVIRDFNHNLQDQFGDNFKELNVAVGRLLTWQEHYKDSIEQTQSLLIQTRGAMNDTKEAMNSTQKTLDSITQQNITAMEFYAKTLETMNDLKVKGDLLQAQLQEVSNLGDSATKSLNDVNHFFIQTGESFKNLEDLITRNVEEMKSGLEVHLGHFDEYAQGNVEILRKFLETSSTEVGSNTSAMLQQHTSLFRESLEKMAGHTDEVLKNVINAANTQLERLSNELEKNIQQNIESNTHNSAEFARLREHIAKNHTAILESLESSLTKLNGYNEQIMQDLSKGLKNMQDMYLSTLTTSMDSVMNKEQELIHSRIESISELAHKTDANLNTQYENTHQFLKKIATEYLKIMQKLTKDSVAIPKDMGVQIVKDFGDLQHNLLSHLGNLNAQIQHNSVQLIELYRNVQKILNENIDGSKHLQQEIRSTFSSLDESMSASMENFKENYEWFLRRVREIIGSR